MKVLLILFLPIYLSSMNVDHLDFTKYYHSDEKELNLSNLPIGDENLSVIEPQLKTFVESIAVEKLIIENADLKTVPYTLIGFALICKSLKYVSFLNNNFIPPSEDIESGTRPRSNSLLESAVSTVWSNISPEIEKAITEHNSNGYKFKYYNKIVVVDKGIPPITILDSYRKPYSKCERARYVFVRIGYISIGIIITSIPTILPWILDHI